MAIDPKKIEEWDQILREVYPLGGMVYGQRERAGRHAVQLAGAASALLAERDGLLSALKCARERTIREIIDYVKTWTGPTGTGTYNIRDAVAERLAALLKKE